MARKDSEKRTTGPLAGRSRRGLILGAAGAVGLLAGETIAGGTPAQAGSDGDVVLGGFNTASTTTRIDTSPTASDAVDVQAGSGIGLSASNTGTGLPGSTIAVFNNAGSAGGIALFAISDRGTGVYGTGEHEGVYAQSGATSGTTPGATRNGVHGVTDSAIDSAVWGEAVAGGTGVTGTTSAAASSGSAGVTGWNFSDGPAVKGNAGGGAALYGLAANGTEGVYAQSGSRSGTFPGLNSIGAHAVTNDSGSPAVWGENVGGGDGVLGTTSKGAAVIGHATAAHGVGVLAENTGGGTALRVAGPAVFTRSGRAAIRFPHTTAQVTVPGRLPASALVLAVLQNAIPGVWVTAAVPDRNTGRVTLHLNKAPGTTAKPMTAHVAWFVVN